MACIGLIGIRGLCLTPNLDTVRPKGSYDCLRYVLKLYFLNLLHEDETVVGGGNEGVYWNCFLLFLV